VTLHENVTKINSFAFYGCKNLTEINIPRSVTLLGMGAFYNTGLTHITVPNEVTTLGTNVFANCANLTTATLGSGITTLDKYTFNNCSKLTDIYVPWAEGAVANAPWGATKATIHYNSEV
jgi:hypothetical protein